jgi:Skp family chaperone for outer membrane proteins
MISAWHARGSGPDLEGIQLDTRLDTQLDIQLGIQHGGADVNRRPKTTVVLAALLAVPLFWLGALHAGAQQGRNAPAPTAIAVLDVERVRSGLEEWKSIEGRLTEMGDRFQKEIDGIRNRMEQVARQIEETQAVNPDAARLRELRSDFFRLQQQHEIERKIANETLDFAIGEAFVEIYKKIDQAAGAVARANGWDLVLFDSRMLDIERAAQIGGAGEVRARIHRRHIMYAAPRVDISDDVVLHMNNQFTR